MEKIWIKSEKIQGQVFDLFKVRWSSCITSEELVIRGEDSTKFEEYHLSDCQWILTDVKAKQQLCQLKSFQLRKYIKTTDCSLEEETTLIMFSFYEKDNKRTTIGQLYVCDKDIHSLRMASSEYSYWLRKIQENKQ